MFLILNLVVNMVCRKWRNLKLASRSGPVLSKPWLLLRCLINMMGLECTRTSLHNQRARFHTVLALCPIYLKKLHENAEVVENRDKVERNAYPLDFSAKIAFPHLRSPPFPVIWG